MNNLVLVHCEKKRCIYFTHDEDEGEAYQNQCENDEIEIGEDLKCYSYEEIKGKKKKWI